MWGAARHDVSTGIHRPLTATALTLAPTADAAAERRCLVAIDHCLFWTAEMAQFKRRVGQVAGIDPGSLTVFFSHTHAAGLMGLERRDLPGGELIPAYLEQTADAVGRLVAEAIAGQRAATFGFTVGRCSLAANRDFWDDDLQRFVCGFNPDASADDSVLVGRLTDDSGRCRLTLVNYACHPTTLAWDNTLISPDYVGAMRQLVESATEAPCFFIQGASGDVGPREGFVGDLAVADRNGRQLGHAVLSALESLPPPLTRYVYSGAVVSGATIGTWRHQGVDDQRGEQLRHWQAVRCAVDLPLRGDLPRRELLEAARQRYLAEQQTAEAAGDAAAAGDARAMAERATRRLVRLGHLPTGKTYAYRTTLLRIGDIIWVPLGGEHYNVLQTELRRRFPDHTLVIGTLADGSDVWYLPDADSYGKGLYQEEASILARGSLETLIEALSGAIHQLVDSPQASEPDEDDE